MPSDPQTLSFTLTLTQVGHVVPTLWQPTLKLASQLLAAGGICMQYDTDKWGGFANQAVMQQYASAHGLTFVSKAEPIQDPGDADGRFFAVLFRKESTCTASPQLGATS